ncbi:MAG: tRNA (adenine(22)-N(1))-methyltransferase TrmK, partial [Eubacteriales bacterium]
KAMQIKRFILQPMGGSGQLREWLTDNGWRIADEDLVSEDDHIYEVILAVPGQESTSDRTLNSIGPRLFEKRHPLLSEVLTREINHNRKILDDMRQSSVVDTVVKCQTLQERNKNLEWIVECLSSAKR